MYLLWPLNLDVFIDDILNEFDSVCFDTKIVNRTKIDLSASVFCKKFEKVDVGKKFGLKFVESLN